MRLKHFGDSYDIVKKSMLQWLEPFGPWAAHPMFTEPFSARNTKAFSRFLNVPLISTDVLLPSTNRFEYFNSGREFRSLLIDPDTGISLTDVKGQRRPKYLFVAEFVDLVSRRPDGLLLVFDQSLRRGGEESALRGKLEYLAERGVSALAYVSHASFVVASSSPTLVDSARSVILESSGLPPQRLLSLDWHDR